MGKRRRNQRGVQFHGDDDGSDDQHASTGSGMPRHTVLKTTHRLVQFAPSATGLSAHTSYLVSHEPIPSVTSMSRDGQDQIVTEGAQVDDFEVEENPFTALSVEYFDDLAEVIGKRHDRTATVYHSVHNLSPTAVDDL